VCGLEAEAKCLAHRLHALNRIGYGSKTVALLCGSISGSTNKTWCMKSSSMSLGEKLRVSNTSLAEQGKALKPT